MAGRCESQLQLGIHLLSCLLKIHVHLSLWTFWIFSHNRQLGKKENYKVKRKKRWHLLMTNQPTYITSSSRIGVQRECMDETTLDCQTADHLSINSFLNIIPLIWFTNISVVLSRRTILSNDLVDEERSSSSIEFRLIEIDCLPWLDRHWNRIVKCRICSFMLLMRITGVREIHVPCNTFFKSLG